VVARTFRAWELTFLRSSSSNLSGGALFHQSVSSPFFIFNKIISRLRKKILEKLVALATCFTRLKCFDSTDDYLDHKTNQGLDSAAGAF